MYSSVERLLSRGPELSIVPEEEVAEIDVAAEGAVQADTNSGISDSFSQLYELVRSSANVFHLAPCGDSPVRVEPLEVEFKAAAVTAGAQPRAYFPAKMAWLARCIETLVALELVYSSMMAVWAGEEIASPVKLCSRRAKGYGAEGNARCPRPGGAWCLPCSGRRTTISERAIQERLFE